MLDIHRLQAPNQTTLKSILGQRDARIKPPHHVDCKQTPRQFGCFRELTASAAAQGQWLLAEHVQIAVQCQFDRLLMQDVRQSDHSGKILVIAAS